MKLNLMLDSGAYSARHAGTVISPEAYRDYAVANACHVAKVVALDLIPGLVPDRKGGPPRLITPKESAQTSYDNWRMLVDSGVNAMPVFHRGESWTWLDRYVSERAEWIGLASRGSNVWLDAVFSRYPRARFHGFAETRLPVLLAHPWYSVDSRTAIECASYGQAFVPSNDKDDLGLVFFGPEDTKYPHRHYHFAPPSEQRRIRRVVESYGFTVEWLDGGSRNRAIYNALVLSRIVRERAVNPTLRVFSAVSKPKDDPFGDWPREIPDRLVSYAFIPDGYDLGEYRRVGRG